MSENDQSLYKGRISFINYEKQFATIDYLHNNKEKSVNFKTNVADDGKKPRSFKLGDRVSFALKLSDRGDKMTAYAVKFMHNPEIDLLVQKALIENRFSGYLKIVDDQYFVKEIDSYILFPLQLSPWEKPPVETAANEAISFRMLNLEKPNSIVASLFSHNYIPEYKRAISAFNDKIPVDATISRVSPHAVYINLVDDKIQAKLPLTVLEEGSLKEGDNVRVMITHLSPTRIVVEAVK